MSLEHKPKGKWMLENGGGEGRHVKSELKSAVMFSEVYQIQ
jgi:hypothetical protein